MSRYQNQYGAAQTGMTDEYGNPVNQLDQYGNPVSGGGFTGEAGRQHFGTTGAAGHGHGQQHRGDDQTTGYETHTGGAGGYGSTNTGSGYGTGTGYGGSTGAAGHGHGHGQQHRGDDQTTGYGTNTGGVGGYGTKPEYGSTNTGSGYGAGTGTGYGGTGTTEYVREEHHGDKKGVMDKIKEKIPGTEQSRTNTDGTGYGTTGYGASGGGIGNTGQEYVREEHHVHHGDQQQHGEKKGIMDKIKEKLPGTGGCTGH